MTRRPTLTRRALGGVAIGTGLLGSAAAAAPDVNGPRAYPTRPFSRPLECTVDPGADLGAVDRRIFGTNLEWFNEAGGLDSGDSRLRETLTGLLREQQASVLRFPGGILADYYDWRDGTGPRDRRPTRRHATDSGQSRNGFGSPEFFALLRSTGAEGLITLNAGTGTAQEAAAWVAYANQPSHPGRAADGNPAPAGIRLWEVGNELYLPGNPGERKIGKTPEAYAATFNAFADAIRAVDPGATVIAIGTAKSHIGPDTPYTDWTERVLAAAGPKMDMLAVHNAYFPLLYTERQPSVAQVYPALWAAPEAVDRSLTRLDALIARHEGARRIGIAVTEWGALFSVPHIDPFWADHVKTIGSAVYMARLLQIFIAQPRMRLANYFKFADRSFMGWVGYDGVPKVPYWVFRLYAETTGDRRIAALVDSPTYDSAGIGIAAPERGVAEVTVVATRKTATGQICINFVNRSMDTVHDVMIRFKSGSPVGSEEIRSVSAREPTAHNGRDYPPELPINPEHEPYSTAQPGSIRIQSRPRLAGEAVKLPPFSVTSLIITPAAGRSMTAPQAKQG